MPLDSTGLAECIARFAKCSLPCIGEQIFKGRSHKVYSVRIGQDICWVARITLDNELWSLDSRGYTTLNFLKAQCPAMLIPKVHYLRLGDSDNDPIALMDWIPGNSLNRWNHNMALYKRQHLLKGLADFLLDLWSTRVPDKPLEMSYSEWLQQDLDRGLRRTLKGTSKWGHAIDYLIMRSMIPYYAEEVNHIQNLGIAHGDLNARNFIVDDDATLMGVIDWDWTYTGPLPAVVQFPWFLADIPGWHNDDVEENEHFEDDRVFLLEALRKKIPARPSAALITKLLEGARERQFFQSSFHYKSIHEEFVKRYCDKNQSSLSAAAKELEAFLSQENDVKQLFGLQPVKDFLNSEHLST